MAGPVHIAPLGRVLVTRPQPAGSQTVAKLVSKGYEPVLLPLSRTVALSFAVPEGPFAALTVTSANAFQHINMERLKPFRGLPLFAVGQGTAQAARKAGFSHVIDGGGDAVRLAATMRSDLPEQSRVLYLAGRVRQPVFEDEMRAGKLDMHVVDVYDTETISYTTSTLLDVLHGAPFVAVMLYSGVAATNFIEAVREVEPPFDEKTRFLCISARVAERLPSFWRAKALVADHPDEEGLFRLFAKL
ncbi:uroporphyrinogen-III synthase [Ochrobactrum vermis]|uniref:Uroporphyrinogen-III synthase n=1 Tax=Ochrobactrum vermis TaxID=1827297 RepID=A0ABU8PGI4_9HYPH|nr:uroporphyrinogen-III synthase [Ochrobactrum vermis]PQZ30838.1 uroporphyrinogen-III synthase [Ochrobactrum vermis]